MDCSRDRGGYLLALPFVLTCVKETKVGSFAKSCTHQEIRLPACCALQQILTGQPAYMAHVHHGWMDCGLIRLIIEGQEH